MLSLRTDGASRCEVTHNVVPMQTIKCLTESNYSARDVWDKRSS